MGLREKSKLLSYSPYSIILVQSLLCSTMNTSLSGSKGCQTTSYILNIILRGVNALRPCKIKGLFFWVRQATQLVGNKRQVCPHQLQ